METILDFLRQPWHWSVSGLLIAMVMFLMLFSGRRFGVSSSFETACAFVGAGKWVSLFRFNWRDRQWQLVFLAGSIIGGLIAALFLANPKPMAISEETLAYLAGLGVDLPDPEMKGGLVPDNLFSWSVLTTWQGWVMLAGGGFLIGFGTRYAKGCTSGHAISGLANLQWPSLIAVVGFFIGGLTMTYLLLPLLLKSMSLS